MLVAIAIPIFTSQLEKSKEATDIANIRSAYASFNAAAMTGTYTDSTGTIQKITPGNTYYYDPNVGDIVATAPEKSWFKGTTKGVNEITGGDPIVGNLTYDRTKAYTTFSAQIGNADDKTSPYQVVSYTLS